MALAHSLKESNIRNHAYNETHLPIRCMQINLQHSRTATDNIMNLSEQDKTDILFIQEPYLYNHKIAGISTKNRIYTSHEDKSSAAIVINNRYRRSSHHRIIQLRLCTPRNGIQQL